ncbi:FAD-binding oxidoreductase [Paracoccus sp. Z118]|uniref:NAD(P)/FAD-dependent oxidoreductase n=1 Tax=Paracoccus sp. Z118 TaxID=2851017 RepID=UPI001C2CA45A|nr:FAD-dependent oxidoreductase [Paracoccus sp. Z118]MBV0893080.1 FAD-binding oxidoreductase [Paracoccus sp. Z118]
MRRNSSPRWDLIVVGGGIVGCSAAYHAARQGQRVLLLERETPGAAQSGRNLGFVRQQNRDFRELPLAMASIELWKGIEAELGRKMGWFQGGNVALAVDEATEASQAEWQARARDYGLDTRILSASEVADKVPLLSQGAGVRSAMYTASDGRAEPGRATRAFFEAAVERGASVSLGAAVSAIETSAGRVSGVRLGDLMHEATAVLCAAGAGSRRLLRSVGIDLPQELIRATVARTSPSPEQSVDPCVSAPLTGIRQDSRGSMVISVAGGEYDLRLDSWRYMRLYAQARKDNPDAARVNFLAPLQRLYRRPHVPPLADIPPTRDNVWPEPRRVAQALVEFRQYFPALADLPIEASWAGVIDTLPDMVPVLGGVEDLPGLLIATGFSGHGFGPGPMAGKIMAELAGGRSSSIDLTELSPMRLNHVQGQFRPMTDAGVPKRSR